MKKKIKKKRVSLGQLYVSACEYWAYNTDSSAGTTCTPRGSLFLVCRLGRETITYLVTIPNSDNVIKLWDETDFFRAMIYDDELKLVSS